MNLFKEEVYASMHKHSSTYQNNIECALKEIETDSKLQDFLRTYADKNGIRERSHGDYGIGDPMRGTFVRKDITLWKDQGKYPCSITIGLDPLKTVMPLHFNYFKTGTGWGGDTMYYYTLQLKEKNGAYHLEGRKGTDQYEGERLISTALPKSATRKTILSNLERAVEKMLKETKPQNE